MEKKVSALVFLLMLLVIDELMVESEARGRVCYTKSRKYNGTCFMKRHVANCRTICKGEKFTGGRCSRGTCECWKKCSVSSKSPPPPPPPAPKVSPPEDGPPEEGDGGDGGGDQEAVKLSTANLVEIKPFV